MCHRFFVALYHHRTYLPSDAPLVVILFFLANTFGTCIVSEILDLIVVVRIIRGRGNLMDVEEALGLISEIANMPLRDLGLSSVDVINKGATGQLLELAIGLTNNSSLKDLADGEIKSTKFLLNRPAETVAVTQLRHLLEEIDQGIRWPSSKLAMKLEQIILVPIHKDADDPLDWHFDVPVHVGSSSHSGTYQGLREDADALYRHIQLVMAAGELHTANGPNNLLQIRTKDSMPYSPIVWNGREIANKGMAFYLTKKFVLDVTRS